MRRFWYHVLTCNCDRPSLPASAARSLLDRYFCCSKLRSSWLRCCSVNTVRFRRHLIRPGRKSPARLCSGHSPVPRHGELRATAAASAAGETSGPPVDRNAGNIDCDTWWMSDERCSWRSASCAPRTSPITLTVYIGYAKLLQWTACVIILHYAKRQQNITNAVYNQ